MFKGFEYNKECRKLADRGVYAQEHKILCDFLASDHKNVRLEYSNEKEATNASQSLRNWTKKERKPLKIVQRKNFVFGMKKGEE